jgi:hypothetical protein
MRTLMLAGALAGFVASAPVGAVVTSFASYTQLGTASTVRNERVGATGNRLYTTSTGTSTVPGSVGVSFNFLSPSLVAAGLSNLSATMTLNLSQTGNTVSRASNFLIQSGYVGTFSFIYSGTAPLVVGGNTYSAGANLLSGSIGGSDGGAVAGSGTSGGLSAATGPSRTVSYTSDFLDFANVQANDLALGLTSITPGLSAGANQSLNSFRASSTGSFSSDPAPIAVGSVPEPATWGMLVLGFGLVGGHMRRRRLVVTA